MLTIPAVQRACELVELLGAVNALTAATLSIQSRL